MSLQVDEYYAGPRSGTFFKVLWELDGQLYSTMRDHPYVRHGPMPPVPPNPDVDAQGYHVFTHRQDAAEHACLQRRRLYAVTARAEDFVAGGLWTFGPSAIFRQLYVDGPVTANLE